MHIGFVGSKIRLDHVRKVVDTFFTDITPVYVEDEHDYYNEKSESSLLRLQNKLNGIIFCGELQHEFYNNLFSPQIPCSYFRKDWSSLQNAMLKLALMGIDFKHTSIDSYTDSAVRHLIGDLDMPADVDTMYVIKRERFQKGYSDSVAKKHMELFHEHKVEGCITALYPVYAILKKQNIPVVYVRPTTEVISRTIHQLIQQYDLRSEKSGNNAILIVQILPKNEYSYIRRDEYLYMHEKIKVAEEIYYFARNTKAAVVSESGDKFVVLMNKDDLLEYTSGFQRFHLIHSIHANTNCDVNIGIGYGFDPSEAKFHANLAIDRLDAESTNLTYIVSNQEDVVGPLNFLISKNEDTPRIEETYVHELAGLTGLSQTAIYNLYTLIEKQKKNCFTCTELSKKLTISQRSSNRMLRRLEAHGLANYVGKKLTGTSGRPSDVYEILLKNHKK